MTIRAHGTVEKRKTVKRVRGWKITTPTCKKGFGFFAPDTEIREGFKPKEGDEVTFIYKKVDGRRQATDVQKKGIRSKARPKLQHFSFGVLVIVILAFIVVAR